MFIVELLSSVLVLLVVRLNKAKVFENLLLLVDGMTEILIMFSLLQTVKNGTPSFINAKFGLICQGREYRWQ